MENKANPEKIAVGRYISHNRKLMGLSQENLAQLTNISSRSMSNIENGYFYPSLPVAYRINNLLNISLLDFIANINSEPLLLFNSLYEQYLYYFEIKDFDKLKELFNQIEILKKDIPIDSVYYKKFLFVLSLDYLTNQNISMCYENLKKAYSLKLPASQRSKILDYKIFLLKESIAPDLGKTSEQIDEIAIQSIKNLEKVLPELDDKPKMKMSYLYNIIVIKIENLDDYDIKELLIQLLDISLTNNRIDVYHQAIFYRGLYKNTKSYKYFYEDIDQALMYFYITKNNILFYHDINLLKSVNLISLD